MYRRLIPVFILLLLFTQGCQPNPGAGPIATAPPNGEDTGAESEVEEAEVVAQEEDSEPRTLFISDIIDIAPIDPATYSHTIGRTMIRNVYDPLVYYELGGYTVEPRLATSWEASEDGLEYTFTLREGVAFHNGDPFTAEDVKVTFDRVAAIGQNVAPASLGDSVRSVEVIDDYTVKFTLNFPYAYFVDVLPKVPIINAEDVTAHEVDGDWANEWFLNNANGTGPYKFASWTPGESYVLERNEDWYLNFQENAYDRVVMRIINDGAQQRQLLERGELHLVSDWIGAIDKIDAAESSEQVRLVNSGGLMNLILIIHGGREPTDNKLVRQALFWAFPYEQFMEYYQGYAEPPTSVIDKDYPGSDPSLEPLRQDLDRARELLAEAGYPEGGFSLDYDYDQGTEEKNQAALLYQAALAELGIELQINPVPGPTWFEKGRNREAAAHFNPHYEAPETPDPFQWIQKMFGSGGYLNWHYLPNEELDAIIAEAQVTADAERRIELFQRAQQIIHEEAMAIPMSDFDIIHPQSVCVQGFTFDPLDLQGVPKFWPLSEDPSCNS